jgi:hypothetical protein
MAKPGRRRRQVERRPARPASAGPPFAVADREVAIRAQHVLSTWQLRMSGLNVWESLESTRAELRAAWGEWPAWCWMPAEVASLWAFRHLDAGRWRHAGPAEVEDWLSSATTTRRDRQMHLTATMQLAAAANWRLTRGVYRFDSELRRALLQTAVEEVAPEVLLQLPEWCVYVDLDAGEQMAEDRAVGFYAYVDWIPRSGAAVLRLLLVVEREEPRRLVWVPQQFPLHHRSVRAAWEDSIGLAVRDADELFGAGYERRAQTEWESSVRLCLPLLLYLASQEPDVRHRRDRERRPERRRRERDEGGPSWWEVGYRVGAALRARPGPEVEPGPPGAGGRSPAPHIRRAHYHLYWTGRGRQEPRIRWLHPILVGDPEGHELPPTVRRVEALTTPGGGDDAARQGQDRENLTPSAARTPPSRVSGPELGA